MSQPPEVWMRGALPGYPALLQPVAHSLLQSLEEVRRHLVYLTPEQLWHRPNGAASIGYHVRHAAGSLDRLLTYARGEMLSAGQLAALKAEADPDLEAGAGDRGAGAGEKHAGVGTDRAARCRPCTAALDGDRPAGSRRGTHAASRGADDHHDPDHAKLAAAAMIST
jgi:hypothetical protein